MNLESKLVRELIEYASRNNHDVVIRTTYCLIEFYDCSCYVVFFDTTNGVCITRSTRDRNINPVEISVDDFKSLFAMKN